MQNVQAYAGIVVHKANFESIGYGRLDEWRVLAEENVWKRCRFPDFPFEHIAESVT